MALTTVDQGLLSTAAQYTGFKNRIINGQMQIDQRNAGASGTATGGAFPVDRTAIFANYTSAVTWQQNLNSLTPPAGFIKYLGVTATAAKTLGVSERMIVYQNIEGLNVADLAWGTASAATVTLSFWVRSSLTGTFGGSLCNAASDRSYPFSYTISSANTWEQKSVTIAGDTSGTWLTTNGIGITVQFSLGSGTSVSTTAGAWAAGYYSSATGATSVVGTNGATFYITGVQLEKGSTATSFDYRPYGTELVLCQRYIEKNNSLDGNSGFWSGNVTNGVTYFTSIPYAVSKRTAATITIDSSSNSGIGSVGATSNAESGFRISAAATSTANGAYMRITWTASAEL